MLYKTIRQRIIPLAIVITTTMPGLFAADGRPDFVQPDQKLYEYDLANDQELLTFLDEHTTVIETRIGDMLTGHNMGEKELVISGPDGNGSTSADLPINTPAEWKINYSARTKKLTYTFGGATVSAIVKHPVSEILIRSRSTDAGISVSPMIYQDAYKGLSTFDIDNSNLQIGQPFAAFLPADIRINTFGANVKIIRLSLEHITDEFELTGLANLRVAAGTKPMRSQLAFQIKLNCNTPAFPRPDPGEVTFDKWKGQYEVSDSHGLTISGLTHHNRGFLSAIGEGLRIPYGALKTAKRSVETQFNLLPNGQTGDFEYCRLINWQDMSKSDRRILLATYQLHGPTECMRVSQWIEFHKEYNPYNNPHDVAYPNSLAGRPSNPVFSEVLYPTARFVPVTYYEYYSSNDDHVQGMRLPTELRWSMNTTDSLFDMVQDPDSQPFVPGLRMLSGISVGDSSGYPTEIGKVIMWNGSQAAVPDKWDNYHYTSNEPVLDIPWFNPPGCADCVHIHWRWGTFLRWPNGNFLIPKGSNQTVTLFMLPQSQGNPINYFTELNGEVINGVAQSLVYEAKGQKDFENFFIHGSAYNGTGTSVSGPWSAGTN